MVTDFTVYILSNTCVSVCILIWGNNSAPCDKVVNNFDACITESTPRVNPYDAWKFLVKRLWSCAATINLSVSALNPELLNHWGVSCFDYIGFLALKWVFAMLRFWALSIVFFPFFLTILFSFRALSVFFISLSNSISRSKSISRANSLYSSFTT